MDSYRRRSITCPVGRVCLFRQEIPSGEREGGRVAIYSTNAIIMSVENVVRNISRVWYAFLVDV